MTWVIPVAIGAAQYQQQGSIGKYNQAVQNRNAQVAEQEDKLIQQQAEFDVASFDKKFRQLEGETKVSLAKSGVVQGSGSARRIEEANSIEAQLQRNVIKYNANVNSYRRMEEANFARIQGQVARQQARLDQIGTLTKTGTSLLTIRWASPSISAVFPTPGSPMRIGLFLVLLDKT